MPVKPRTLKRYEELSWKSTAVSAEG